MNKRDKENLVKTEKNLLQLDLKFIDDLNPNQKKNPNVLL